MSAGTIYKLSLGPRGMAVGCLVGECFFLGPRNFANFAIRVQGGVLGTLAGSVMVGVCHLTGIDMDHIRYYQHEWMKQEKREEKQEMMKIIVEDENYATAPLHKRDEILGKNLALSSLDANAITTANKPEDKK